MKVTEMIGTRWGALTVVRRASPPLAGFFTRLIASAPLSLAPRPTRTTPNQPTRRTSRD